jgi:hypothetical protein
MSAGCGENGEMAVSAPASAPRLSWLALGSLSVAVLAWGLLAFTRMPAPLPAGVALLLALGGRWAIRRRPQRLTGRGTAAAGLGLALLHLVVTVPLLILGQLAV